ncbi:hypothetical protein GE061_006669 [Apolygus lucorum]|uniref:Uncharacterized protein n=1 Tax=Apolygus lucorum TaxID=248454 RepID=A0A6A4IYN7_APOLU|nr:hypothetical protein GE061_006669 [Apolygus lucorum]
MLRWASQLAKRPQIDGRGNNESQKMDPDEEESDDLLFTSKIISLLGEEGIEIVETSPRDDTDTAKLAFSVDENVVIDGIVNNDEGGVYFVLLDEGRIPATKNKTICDLDVPLNFISLPKMPQHYYRETTAKPPKVELYRIYLEKSKKEEEELLSVSCKDRCDTCVAYEENNITAEKFEEYHMNKEKARVEKEKDKEEALKANCRTLCCDLMAVQFLPRITASAAYYKHKLAVHNYTVYNLAKNYSKNYWFYESEATLPASTFA